MSNEHVIEGPRSRKEGLRRLLTVSLVLTGLTMLTFSYVIVGNQPTAGRYDVYRYYGPISFYLDACLHQGEMPYWNPLSYCGVPMPGNPQTFMFYPLNLIRSLLTPAPTPYRTQFGLVVLMGLHFIFMGVCFFYFARAHGLKFTPAITASIVLLFSALMVRRMGEYHFIFTMAWLPLILLTEKKALDAETLRNKLYYAIVAGLLLGLSFLGGFIQIANLMGLSVGVYAFFYCLAYPRVAEGPGLWRRQGRVYLNDGMVLVIIFALAVLLPAMMFFSSQELAAFTVREKGNITPKYSDLWKWTLADFFQKMIVYPGMKYEAETIHGSGIAALLLTLAGLTYARRRDVVIFTGLMLILFECSFGPPLPLGAFLERITPFSMSAYSRGWDFAMFPMAMLAGMGVQALSQPMDQRPHTLLRTALLAIAAVCTLVPLSGYLAQRPFINPGDWAVIVPAAACVVMLVSGTFHWPATMRWLLVALLPVLVFAETWTWNAGYVAFLAKQDIKDAIPIREGVRTFPLDNVRDVDPICNRFLYSLRPSMNGVDPLHLAQVRELLSGGDREKHPYRGVKDYECTRENQRGNLLFKRRFWLARQFSRDALPDKQSLFPAATTVFLKGDTANVPLPEVQAAQVTGTCLSENRSVVPLENIALLGAPFTGGVRRYPLQFSLPKNVPNRAAGPAGAVHSALVLNYVSNMSVKLNSQIALPGGDRRVLGKQYMLGSSTGQERSVEIPLPDYPQVDMQLTVESAQKGVQGQWTVKKASVISDNNDEDGLIKVVAFTANTAEVEVGELPDFRILTYLDAMFPGWTATIDGQPAPIMIADEAFKAVLVPAGKHRVRFVLAPRKTYWGMAVSFATLGGALLALYWLRLASGNRQSKATMRLLDYSFDAPAENLALDEVLLDRAEEGVSLPTLRFWECPRRFVVIGTAQILAREADEAACQADGVPILRRCSAGGAVLQGPGSLNFAFALRYDTHPETKGLHASYDYLLNAIAGAFQSRGIPAHYEGICDLAIGGGKISGNAQRRRRRALLHHGTLLYRPDYAGMERYLREPEDRPEYRGPRNHREFVGELPIDPKTLRAIVCEAFHIPGPAVLPEPEELAAAHTLAQEKYLTQAWTYRR